MTTPSQLSTRPQLLRSCWQILKRQPKLLLFPLVNATVAAVIALFFMSQPLLEFQVNAWLTAQPPESAEEKIAQSNSVTVALYLIALYMLSMFAATFVNVAFYHEIFRAMESGTVSIRRGLRFAAGRLRSIFLWSLLASSVGIVLKAIDLLLQTTEGRLGRLGAFLARVVWMLLGAAWSLAAIFVIPTLIRDENAGPLTLLRNSTLTLKNTWGESIPPYLGFLRTKVITFFCLLILGLICAFGIATIFGLPMIIVSLPIILLPIIGWAWAAGAVTSVYRCALYVYATEGVVPEPFTPELMDADWKMN
jgi:hypothetical protein